MTFKTIPAGAVAASVLALTHGVLTTMKFAQLRWIGIAVLATTLAAGGVIAVAVASGQSPTRARNVEEVAVNVGDPVGDSSSPASTLNLPVQNASPNAVDPFRPNSGLPKSDARPEPDRRSQ